MACCRGSKAESISGKGYLFLTVEATVINTGPKRLFLETKNPAPTGGGADQTSLKGVKNACFHGLPLRARKIVEPAGWEWGTGE